jgi:hypothetical protein
MLVTGPALLGLKGAARQMLLQQGFSEDEIPHPLRPLEKPDDYGELIARRDAEGYRYRAMQLHNQTGYGAKPINVLKATLYETMPAGSMLIVPDSLWNSPFWAGMLVGNALRGGRVFVISPALDNAPSAGFPQMSRAQEIFAEMILVQQMLGDEIAAAGGSLHTSIYAVDLDVGDLAGRIERFYDNQLDSPLTEAFLGSSEAADPALWAEYRRTNRRNKAFTMGQLEELGFEPGYVVGDVGTRQPKLHLKAQLFLNRAAINIFQEVDWLKIIEQSLLYRARQASGDEYVDLREAWPLMQHVIKEQGARVQAEARAEDIAKAAGYLTVGSHNMDYRGMMMDGEVLYVTSGGGVLPGVRDLFLIAGVCTWVETLEELEALVPAYSEWQRRVGRFIKYAL